MGKPGSIALADVGLLAAGQSSLLLTYYVFKEVILLFEGTPDCWLQNEICSMMDDFYRPIALGENQIRLLRLSPSGSRSMEIFDTSHQPDYYTLSYAWHERSDQSFHFQNTKIEISVSGRPQCRQVHYNLWIFFKYVHRWLTPPQYLWIDFLCIDQSNTDERSQQVARMHTIYTSCTGVIVWLGDYSVKAWQRFVDGPLAENETLDSNHAVI